MGEDSANRFRIRGFRPGDLESLRRIDEACFEPGIAFDTKEFLFHLSRPHSVTRVAEIGGVIAGFAIGYMQCGTAGYVVTIDVLGELQRKGVGTALMAALHELFRRAGAEISYLEADSGNEIALAFYRHLGYEPLEILEGYYTGGRDAIRMKCKLS